jgi:hypothetical protein
VPASVPAAPYREASSADFLNWPFVDRLTSATTGCSAQELDEQMRCLTLHRPPLLKRL